MIESMTGFARRSVSTPLGVFTCELRSVNSRYLDLNLRLPESCRSSENALRELLKGSLVRGKVDATLRHDATAGTEAKIALNTHLVDELIQADKTIRDKVDAPAPLDPLALLQWPGVIGESDQASEKELIIQALFKEGVDELVQVREAEGEKLRQAILQRVEKIEDHQATVSAKAPSLVSDYQTKLKEKILELTESVEPERLAQEVAIMASKSDIAEELDRLLMHVSAVKKSLSEGGVVGRRLDFLMQELNREANTLGSKSVDAEVTAIVVELKVLIEQMREQVQNIQ